MLDALLQRVVAYVVTFVALFGGYGHEHGVHPSPADNPAMDRMAVIFALRVVHFDLHS